MLREWIKSLWHYLGRAYGVMGKNVNGQPFSMVSIWAYHFIFIGMSLAVVYLIPKGLGHEFIDYIKDIFAIFVGFFVTVLTFVFDKLDVEGIPTQEEMDKLPVNKRWSTEKILKVKREHNYTIRFFYTIGLIILYSAITIILLIPNIFWTNFFDVNLNDYVFISSIGDMTWSSLLLFFHLLGCFFYRFLVVYLTFKVFYFTFYSVCSLLQVLISKKKIEVWN